MRIEYKNTFEELLNYEKLKIKKNKKLSIFFNFVFYAYILILVSIIIYFTYIDKAKGKDFWIFIISILAIIIAWIIVIPKLKIVMNKMSVKIIIKKFPYVIERRTLEIDNEIIKITNSQNVSSIINKNDIGEIVEIENSIYLISGEEKNPLYTLAIIPLNIFEKEEEKEKFLLLLNEFR